MTLMKHRILAIALLLTATGLLAACASPGPQSVGEEEAGTDDFMTMDQLQLEFEEAGKGLPLPEDEHYPPATAVVSDYENVLFEKGSGETYAYYYYSCEWMHEYLDAVNDDAARAASALAVIRGFPDQPIFKEHYDQDSFLPIMREMVDAADLGDSSKVQADVDLNCQPRRAGQ